MADEPKIILDPAPAVPVDVQVSPDPGPMGTFDVPTTPDPSPREPFDVKISPDPDPRGVFDVPVSPDPAPRAPVNVATTPDPAPRAPVDVQVTADPGPRLPVDVPLTLDGPPAVPFDVPTTPDPPPAIPRQVATPPDPPPFPPHQVATYPDFPPTLVRGNPGEKPTLQQIIDAVRGFDSALGSFLNGLLQIDPITTAGPGNGAADPRALARWFKDYLNSVGTAGVGKFIAEQSVLYGMNPVVARVFNPGYFAAMLVPGSMGHVHTTVDTQAGLTMDRVAQAKDQLDTITVQMDPRRPGGDTDVYGPDRTPTSYRHASDVAQDFTIDEMVDASVDSTGHPFMTLDRQLGVQKFDATKYFDDRSANGAQGVSRARARAQLGVETVQARESALAASAFIEGVIPVAFRGEDPDGAFYSPTPDPSDAPFLGGIDDDDARVPLCFTDLRKDPSRNAYRSIYFRPLNLTFSTQISPEYAEAGGFGRTDPIVGYVKTVRTVSLSFEVHAFAAEDVRTMYNKLTWLQSLCYPSYTADSLFQSGPVSRLRIGDAIATFGGGLPGVIRNLGIDFGDALWELRKGMKVPRSFKVAVDFLALHEGPVGTVGGQFGVFQLPPNGPAPDKDTNNPGGPTDSRSNSVSSGVTLIQGGFSRFGEPVRKG